VEGTGFLKTVNFGGFDKKDVLAYVDELNTKIYTLEAELDEKKKLLDASGTAGVGSEKYEELLKADKVKITELQTNNDSLRIQMSAQNDEIAEKDREIASLKKQNSTLEDQLAEAKRQAAAGGGADAAMDLSAVFMEAQKSASTIVAQAKDNARKMDEDAKKLANQVVDDANGKASTIVKQADERANRILTEAEDKTAEIRAQAEAVKTSVSSQIAELESNISKLRGVIDTFSGDSLAKLTSAGEIAAKAQSVIAGTDMTFGSIPKRMPLKRSPEPVSAPVPTFTPPPAPKMEDLKPIEPVRAAPPPPEPPKPAPEPPKPAPEPPKPAPEPPKPAAPAPEPPKKPSNKFGFDLSELENLTKMVENSGGEY
jgi:cell division septum initiation protein DivIVA